MLLSQSLAGYFLPVTMILTATFGILCGKNAQVCPLNGSKKYMKLDNRCPGWARQSCIMPWCYRRWDGRLHRIMGQLFEDLELINCWSFFMHSIVNFAQFTGILVCKQVEGFLHPPHISIQKSTSLSTWNLFE